jgi:TRAP transporter TAXI family solute receptor
MKLRLTAGTVGTSLGVCAAVALVFVMGFGAAQTLAPRIAFQVATGSTGGTYFPVGSLIAGFVSNPPGIGRCEEAYVCGPSGLVLSARTSQGAVDNVLAVNAGRVDSGMTQGDVVEQALSGRGAFRGAGRQTHLRVIAGLFPEEVHLVVARKSRITKVSDLRGKRVSLGSDGSGTSVTARAVLSAYGISESAIHARHDNADVDALAMQRGKLDAFFFVGGAPVTLIDDLIERGQARLLSIDGPARARLLKAEPSLSATTLSTATYPGTGPVETVAVRAFWVVRDSVPDDLVYGIARSLFNPVNRGLLDAGPHAARLIGIDTAVQDLPAPVHPGALRFYREMGKYPKLNTKAGKI